MTLATRPIFAVEETAIAPRLNFNRLLLGLLGSTMAIGFIAPVALAQYLPKPFKTMLLGSGLLASIGVASMTVKTRTDEAIASTIQEARLAHVRMGLEHQIAQQQIRGEIQGETQALEMIMRLPEWQQIYYLQKYGLLPLAAPLYPELQAPQQQGAIALNATPTQNNAHDLDISDWEAEQQEAQGSTAPQLYANAIKKSMVWAGCTGEGKTVAAHYALAQWADSDKDLVLYVFDMHFGMGRSDKYSSNWLGVPHEQKPPRYIKSCVVSGDPADLEAFLAPVIKLFQYRKQNKASAPTVVVVVDEFTNLLQSVDEETAERICKAYSQFATEAQKYGIFIWFILHSLTKEDLGGFPRVVLRQCHIVMGAEMTQDTVQCTNSPKKLPPSAIAYAQDAYRSGGLPAGFATSLPVADGYLPVAPVSDLRDLIRDWVTVNDQAEQQAEVQKESEPQAKVEGGNIHQAIANWINEIGRHPTIEEVQDQVEQLMGQRPNKDVAEYLIREYTRRSGL